MPFDDRFIETKTLEVLERIGGSPAPGVVYEPIEETARESTYRSTLQRMSENINGAALAFAQSSAFQFLGRTREGRPKPKKKYGTFTKSVWVSSDGISQLQLFEDGRSYLFITYFDDGACHITWSNIAGPMRSELLTSRDGSEEPAFDWDTHRGTIMRKLESGARALFVADIRVACALGHYYYARVDPS